MIAVGEADRIADATNDPRTRSWVAGADGHPDFPLQNLPFGVFSPNEPGADTDPRGGIRIGDRILDLRALVGTDLLTGPALTGADAAAEGTLNSFFALGAGPRRALRARVHDLLREGAPERAAVEPLLREAATVTMHLPATVGDYTDFYVGIHHAETVGSLYRPDNPLLPNYKWVPIGYHGRASSIRVSGAPFVRPRGQTKPATDSAPRFAPAAKLDFELELGVWIGSGNAPGDPVPIGGAAEHVAGFCLLNDWSARDVQSWEYQPLGPFLAKNFASTVSAWVVTPEALAPYRTPAPARGPGDPAPLAYLADPADQREGGLDIELEVLISTASMREQGLPPHSLSTSSTRHMYWTVAQMIAHHTSGGCDLRPGDLLGTGTLSAPDPSGAGSLLELTHDGARAVVLPTGETRTFLQDGDEILLQARAHRDGAPSIGFGECRAVVLPARAEPTSGT
ncbi:fumarylacetoacetase [Rathayibacter sp. Leaf296]|uniref:fumarylacetoacetase n=1 Tax=Rathayibacter sp. Leaf296 TaxID=1736327 RepID=UPI000702BFF6|nr:fumarylacetoacetase [Rathayibacter sp. Leaf296]KQQ08503.1 fumarylacetoacetase [Rathayibacter sp. Leaf296]